MNQRIVKFVSKAVVCLTPCAAPVYDFVCVCFSSTFLFYFLFFNSSFVVVINSSRSDNAGQLAFNTAIGVFSAFVNLYGRKKNSLKKTATKRTAHTYQERENTNKGKWWWRNKSELKTTQMEHTNHFTHVSFDSAVAILYSFFSLFTFWPTYLFSLLRRRNYWTNCCVGKKKRIKSPQIHSNSWPGWLCIELHLIKWNKGASRFYHRMRATCFFLFCSLIVNFYYILYVQCIWIVHWDTPTVLSSSILYYCFFFYRYKKRQHTNEKQSVNKQIDCYIIYCVYVLFVCVFSFRI